MGSVLDFENSPIQALGLMLNAFGSGMKGKQSLASRMESQALSKEKLRITKIKTAAQLTKDTITTANTAFSLLEKIKDENSRELARKALVLSFHENKRDDIAILVQAGKEPTEAKKRLQLQSGVDKIRLNGELLSIAATSGMGRDVIAEETSGELNVPVGDRAAVNKALRNLSFQEIVALNSRLNANDPAKLDGPELTAMQQFPKETVKMLGIKSFESSEAQKEASKQKVIAQSKAEGEKAAREGQTRFRKVEKDASGNLKALFTDDSGKKVELVDLGIKTKRDVASFRLDLAAIASGQNDLIQNGELRAKVEAGKFTAEDAKNFQENMAKSSSNPLNQILRDALEKRGGKKAAKLSPAAEKILEKVETARKAGYTQQEIMRAAKIDAKGLPQKQRDALMQRLQEK